MLMAALAVGISPRWPNCWRKTRNDSLKSDNA